MRKIHSVFRGRLFAPLICVFLSVGAIPQAHAQDKYPSRPVDFIVPWGPGGGADQLARKVGKLLEDDLKTSFPVINVPGATGNTGMTKLLSAPADGYAMSVLVWDNYATLVTAAPKWKLSDIIPVALMMKQPSAFFVAENSRFKTWADLEREARAKPNALKVAISGFGSPDDITVNYFASKGIKFLVVPFAKPGERYVSILGGHADVLYEQLGDVRSYLDSKQLRPLIVFSAERFPAFKDVPAAKELGYDITLPQRRAIIMKAGTDPQKIKVIADALAKVAAHPEYKAYLKQQYATDDGYVTGKAALAIMQEELEIMKKIAGASERK